MEFLVGWFAFSLAAGDFCEASKVKKESKELKNRIEMLEEVYK